MKFSRLSSVCLLGTIVAFAGCGGVAKVAHPDVSPAAGIVTYNGSAVADAEVVLMSQESKTKGWTCSGKTGTDGKFTISTLFAPGTDAAGIPPGKYTAVVIKTEQPALAVKPNDMKSYEEISKKKMEDAQAGGVAPESTGPKSLVPSKYSVDSLSDLTVTIEKEGNSNIELKLVD
jgi:hypothetical protein